MEKAKTPKSRRLKGFTLLELIIVCALFSMILIGALSVLRPVSLLYKQNVEYESSRATSDIVSTYLEGVLNYADRMWIYEDKCADSSVYNESDELDKFINTYFDGSSGHQPIYIMDIVNDPVVDASGNVIEEGYGRVYMREIGTGKNAIDDTTPRHLAISEGIYEDYGFQIDIQNALPRTLTTTVNVFRKSKNITPTAVSQQNGVLALVDASGNNRYESNGVEVVKSSNMLNICYYDVDLNSPTGIPNYVIVYAQDGTTSKVSSFYSNPNSAMISDATPTSNNYHIIFTLPDQEYYKNAAMNQLEYIDCSPKSITAACNTTKTLDDILTDAGFKVSAKYTNSNVLVEVTKGVLNDGTDGWYVQNRVDFDTNKQTAGTYTYYVYFESEMTTFNITFEEQPLVTSISAQNLIVSAGDTISKGLFSVSVVRGGNTEPIDSMSYSITLADGSDLSSLVPVAGQQYEVIVKYTGDGAAATDISSSAYILVAELDTISAAKSTKTYPVGYTLTDADMDDIVVTANYKEILFNGTPYTPPAQTVTNGCTFSYPTGALAAGTSTITVTHSSGMTTTIPITATESALSVSLNYTSGSVGANAGNIEFSCAVSDPDMKGWTLTITLPFTPSRAQALSWNQAVGNNYSCSGNILTIKGAAGYDEVTLPMGIYIDWEAAGSANLSELSNMYTQLQSGTYIWDYTLTPNS